MAENATTDADREASNDAEKHCYICWEAANVNDLGELHRNCGCRGENGHAHIPCLVTAKKASSNALGPLTRSWLKCNQCQALYADPTKRELIREMNGGESLSKRLLSTFINLIRRLPGLLWLYTVLTAYVVIVLAIYAFVVAAIVLLGPYAQRLYRTSAIETRLICALIILTVSWKYRHKLYRFLRWWARDLARRIGREVYFNFWFAAEGIGANNLSISSKLCAFVALLLCGYLRIRDRGTFDYPFHGRPHFRAGSRLRKAAQYLVFYISEIGYWATFDAYYSTIALIFLAGWAVYIFTIVTALKYFTEKLTGEPLMDHLEHLFDRHAMPWVELGWKSHVFDDFKQEVENTQSEIARSFLDMDLITVGQYIEVDPAVKRVMDDTREDNYWWCCL